MLRAVIFDLDGTLYDYEAAHAVAFAALTDYACKTLSVTPQAFEDLHRRAGQLLKQRCGGPCAAVHNRLIRYQLILELAGAPIAHAPEMAGLYWSTLIGAVRPNPGMMTCLRAVRDMGMVVGIGTNMTADRQFEKLNALGIMSLVDFMVTSEEAGAEKPDRRLFDLCAEKAGCDPRECAFVGDSLKGDALGALNAGMRPIWLCGGEAAGDVPGIARIASLEQLCNVIAAMMIEGDGTHETGP